MVTYDEVRVCPVCGDEILGLGEVSCKDHFKGYSFENLRRFPSYVKVIDE